MNLLVTGGYGFIGSHFVHFLLNSNQNYGIVNLDKLTYASNKLNLESIKNHPNYFFKYGDICDQRLVEDTIVNHNIDIIVNFSAESSVDKSITNSSPFMTTNILGTQILLEVAKKYKIKKFVQVSTDEVYGSLGSYGYFTEHTPVAPNNPYSASKAAADLITLAYSKTYDLNVNITRSTNNYGPFQSLDKLIPRMITNALNNQPLPIYGDGSHVRDWIHVIDHVAAIELVIRKGVPGSIYNIGSHNEMKNIDIVRSILTVLNKPISLIKYVPDRPAHDKRYAIDHSKITKETGWLPTIQLEEGLKKTISWYKKHQSWWK